MASLGSLKVGVLGPGNVGKTLSNGFLKYGHTVKLGSREPEKEDVQTWLKGAGSQASVGTLDETAKFADVIVLTTPWSGTENAIKLAGPQNMKGKLVIDVTNPLSYESGKPSLILGFPNSGGQTVQGWAPEAKVVKCWNTIGGKFMVDPSINGQKPDMWICGNDAEAKKTVTEILKQFGWESIYDHGDIKAAALLEALAMLWINQGILGYGWNHGFKLIK